MARLVAGISCLAVLAVAPAAAQLRYTTHVEMRKLDAPPPADPLLGMLGALVANRIPKGDASTTIGERGARIEFRSAVGPIPAGGVMLIRGGSVVMLNPADRTYWTSQTSLVTALLAGKTPTASSKRTGELATIAGLRTERVTFTWSMDLPIPPGIQLPAGFPTTLTMDGEMWVADQFKAYAAGLNAVAGATFPGMGVGALAQDGLIVRQIVRSALFGGHELEYTISDVVEGPVPDELFAIPEGYREVPTPTPTSSP